MPVTLSESKKELLEKLLRGVNSTTAKKHGIARRSDGVDVPMSYSQQQIWLHSQLSGDVPIYNEPITVHRYGALDRHALERAFTEIVRRHEAWRTTFQWKGAELVQRVEPAPAHIELPFMDVSIIPMAEREAAALNIATSDVMVPFDLAVGPMYRPRLIRFSDDEHRLYLTLHHIIFDGVSLYRTFLSELQVLYEAFVQNLASPLPEPTLQYSDYALWQRKWVEEISPQQLNYWKAKLDGLTHRDMLRPDHPRPAVQGYRGDMVNFALDHETSAALKALSQSLDVTLFMTLLATFYILIWSQSGDEDLIVGVTSAGRPRSELEGMLGCFLNTVIVRNRLTGNSSFVDIANRTRDELFGALANDAVPFPLIAKELSSERNPTRHALLEVLFSFEPPLAPLGPGWKFTRMDVKTSSAKFDLHLELDEFPHGIEGRFIYNRDLFNKDSVERLCADWRVLLSAVASNPHRSIFEIAAPIKRRTEEAAEPTKAVVSAPVTSQQQVGFLQSVRRLFSTR